VSSYSATVTVCGISSWTIRPMLDLAPRTQANWGSLA
jgi:hypothetical protein